MFLIHGSRKRCCMLMCLLLDARINWETHGENFAPEKKIFHHSSLELYGMESELACSMCGWENL